MRPAGEPKDQWGHYIRGPRTKAELLVMLDTAVEVMNANWRVGGGVSCLREGREPPLLRSVPSRGAQEVLWVVGAAKGRLAVRGLLRGRGARPGACGPRGLPYGLRERLVWRGRLASSMAECLE